MPTLQRTLYTVAPRATLHPEPCTLHLEPYTRHPPLSALPGTQALPPKHLKREFFIENLLVRIYFIIEMIRWTGLSP